MWKCFYFILFEFKPTKYLRWCWLLWKAIMSPRYTHIMDGKNTQIVIFYCLFDTFHLCLSNVIFIQFLFFLFAHLAVEFIGHLQSNKFDFCYFGLSGPVGSVVTNGRKSHGSASSVLNDWIQWKTKILKQTQTLNNVVERKSTTEHNCHQLNT